jgi:RNA polymerase sigma-70 factor (ECF subfamily)
MTQDELHELYRRYGPAVRARCRAMCGETDADEALQETFLRAWRAQGRFDGRHPLAWLQTIARNTCVDILRRRRPWVDDPEAWLRLPGSGQEGPARAEVTGLLGRLSPEEAMMLRLRYVEEWRIHELAEHFDTSERSVRRTLEGIELQLRARLGPEVDDA